MKIFRYSVKRLSILGFLIFTVLASGCLDSDNSEYSPQELREEATQLDSEDLENLEEFENELVTTEGRTAAPRETTRFEEEINEIGGEIFVSIEETTPQGPVFSEPSLHAFYRSNESSSVTFDMERDQDEFMRGEDVKVYGVVEGWVSEDETQRASEGTPEMRVFMVEEFGGASDALDLRNE